MPDTNNDETISFYPCLAGVTVGLTVFTVGNYYWWTERLKHINNKISSAKKDNII